MCRRLAYAMTAPTRASSECAGTSTTQFVSCTRNVAATVGKPARIIARMNALVEAKVIRTLAPPARPVYFTSDLNIRLPS